MQDQEEMAMSEHLTGRQTITTPVRTRAFPGHPSQVRQARSFLAGLLHGCPAADTAVLLISEIAANAVAYSASGRPGGTFTVRAELLPGVHIHAELEDQGGNWDGDISASECPHGLYLLRELSNDCGTRRGQQGWITWYTIEISADHEQATQP
jgi:hypothetical protein